MNHYYSVCEPDDAGGFWINFPGRDGITSAAVSAEQIVPHTQDALKTALRHGGSLANLPPAIEEDARPPIDLSGYDKPRVVVIPFTGRDVAKAA
jgi:hypothetical protein